MADRACVQRLQKEFRALCKEPVANVVARPSPDDILDWHFVLEGSEGTPYQGGVYHGKVKFPTEYPFKPPSISMITPNGRFATHKRICMSMSDFHPETWNPMWSVSSILTGLLSFMMESAPTAGSVSSSVEEKRRFAQHSLAFNCRNGVFRKMFPEYVDKYTEQQKAAAEEEEKEVLAAATKNSQIQDTAAVLHVATGRGGALIKSEVACKKFPMWLTAILFALFASIMALPLFALDPS